MKENKMKISKKFKTLTKNIFLKILELKIF